MSYPPRPLSTAMKASTAFVALVPLSMLVAAIVWPDTALVMLLATAVLVPVFVWAVRQSPVSYEVRGGRLLVHGRLGGLHSYRLDGTTRYPAPGLRLRLFGSSGFFGHTGWFLDAEGKVVRAFVSQGEDLVAVGTDQGPIVVSPASPAALVGAVQGGVAR